MSSRPSGMLASVAIAVAAAPSPAAANAPVYFDLGGLLLWAFLAVATFIGGGVIAGCAKSNAAKHVAGLAMIVALILPVYYCSRPPTIPKGSVAIFDNRAREKGKEALPIFASLCAKRAFENIRPTVPVTGFRLLQVKPLSDTKAQALGWRSAIDFYVGNFVEGHVYVSGSLESNLRKTLPLQMRRGVLEYRDDKGSWERLVFAEGEQRIEVGIGDEAQASHGLIFEQISTGYEQSLTIFQVSISVVEINSGALVAQRVDFVHDPYWGEHTSPKLMMGSGTDIRCGRTSENFVASWLAGLSASTKGKHD